MLPAHKRATILASVIGTLLEHYDDDKTSLILKMRSGLDKGFKKIASIYGDEALVGIAQKGGDGFLAWSKTVDHFSQKNISIEASTAILYIWSKEKKLLAKFFGLSRAKIDKFCKGHIDKEIHQNSREVADVLDDFTCELCNIEKEEKPETLKRIAILVKVAKEKKKAQEKNYADLSDAIKLSTLKAVEAGFTEDEVMHKVGINKGQYDFILYGEQSA